MGLNPQPLANSSMFVKQNIEGSICSGYWLGPSNSSMGNEPLIYFKTQIHSFWELVLRNAKRDRKAKIITYRGTTHLKILLKNQPIPIKNEHEMAYL